MQDFLLLEQQLTSEELEIRNKVRKLITSDVLPIIEQAYEDSEFPKNLIPKLADLGLFGMTLGKSNYVAYGLACQELERGDSALRSFVSVQSSLCMYPIYTFGTEEQKQRWLPLMAQGKKIGCFSLTEPESGSDPASMQTVAKKVNGGWEITGTKRWATNASIADVAIIWAKTTDGVRGFLVEKDFPGFNPVSIKNKLSLRVSISSAINLNKCFVPDANLLPGTDKGLQAALECLTQARYGIAWGAIGAAMACYDTVLDYCKQRKQFNKPLAAFQLVQKDLVDMCCEITKAQALNLQVGRLKDAGQANFAMVSMAKMNACKQALAIARKARNLLGANGITSDYPVMRHMNNLESVFTYEGTDNIHHLILGKYLTGCNAFE